MSGQTAQVAHGLRRVRTSEQLLAAIHQESKWEESGGWRRAPRDARRGYKVERDASMVHLLNLLDPDSLVDRRPGAGPGGDWPGSTSVEGRPEARRPRAQSDHDQHSALSLRGVALVGGAAAVAWYLLRLIVRDRLGGLLASAAPARRRVLELHVLSALHALGWVAFLCRKLRSPTDEWPRYCSRALVASLGFYLHDCWALRGTLLHDPAMFLHQASVASTITSILRSKGVAWLAPPLMSLSVPTLAQEVLRLCGAVGLPCTRPEVLALRFTWFVSFAASKLALIPLWLRHSQLPELHQPTLLPGKLSYLAGLALNVRFMLSAARDLRSFLRPAGAVVPIAQAYRVPLGNVQKLGSFVASMSVLGVVFASYLVAPAAGVLALLAASRRSRRIGILAGALSALVALDSLVPMPSEFDIRCRYILPFLRKVKQAFSHRMFPARELKETFREDKQYLLALTPHGFFPWGVAMVLFELVDKGFLPNFVGASVLGKLPVAGRVLRTFGYRPASPKEIQNCLVKPYPRNITIVLPGGIQEMFCIRKDIELSAADAHSGFAKIAKETGSMLVPGYLYGNSQLYEVADGSLARWFERLSRKFKVSLNLFHGRWGTLVPYPHRLGCALGEAIDASQHDTGEEVHRLWLEGLRSAYEAHRADFGWADRPLYFTGDALPPRPENPLDAYSPLPSPSSLLSPSARARL